MRYLFVYLCLFAYPFVAPAQEYSYAHYDTREGLAGSVVYSMVQDKDGFMWFATETGLSRFDGRQFKNFTTADGLPDNEIIKLFVDSKNRMWIIPFKRTVCYYWRGKIYTQKNDSLLKKLAITGDITAVSENVRGEIALLQNRQITIIKPAGQVLTVKRIGQDGLLGGAMAGENEQGEFLFTLLVDNLGVNIFKLQGDSLIATHKRRSPVLNNLYKSYIYKDVQIVCTRNTTNFYFPQYDTAYTIQSPRGLISVSRLNDSIVCLNASSSVQFYNFLTRKAGQVFFRNKNISEVMQDSEGCLWFSSMGEGVYRLPSTEFNTYVFRLENNTLPVFSLKKSGTGLYAGTDHFRLWAINTVTHATRSYGLNEGISLGRIMVIDSMKDLGLLLGTDVGMFILQNKKISPLTLGYSVKAMHTVGDTLVIGVDKYGVLMTKQSIPHIMADGELNKRWADVFWMGRVTAIYKQGDYIYVGTLNGLYRVDAGKKITYLGNLHTALANRIAVIKESVDGALWIATYGDGVVRYENEKVTRVLSRQDGLSSNICRTLFVTDSTLWVGTDKGLCKVEIAGNRYNVLRYAMGDGLISDVINAIYVDKDIVYVGTPAGITYFNEKTVKTNSICILRITGIQSGTNRWNYDTTGLRFGHFENDIRVEFSGISYKSAGDITFHYRLLGLDSNWHITQDNFVSYPALPSGEYELELVAINKFGVFSEMNAVGFTVEELLWEKTWFRLLAIALAGVLVWIFISQRIKHIRKQEAVKAITGQKIAELEQMALRAQMNPHFIFNTLNSIQQYVIDKDIKGANKFITAFSRLVRLTLDFSSRQWITLAEEINYISTYLELEKERFESKFSYEVDCSGVPDVTTVFIPSMLLQPYIENSIRHGVRYRKDDKGNITIRFSIKNNYLFCTIEDNGVGRRFSEKFKGKQVIEYQSKGMALTARRIDMLNKGLVQPIVYAIDDVDGREVNGMPGTKVLLKIPVSITIK